MDSPSREINKMLGEVENSLAALDRAFRTAEDEVDYVPTETTLKAYNALAALNSALVTKKVDVSDLKGRSSVLSAMERLAQKLDDPSVQTMLGTESVEFSGIFRQVLKVLKQKDPKKVESTLFKRLD